MTDATVSETRPTPSAQGGDPPFPELLTAWQVYPEPPEVDARAEARRQVASLLTGIPRGSRVALTVGSRGIDRLAEIVQGAVEALQGAGAQPILIPAMGSHGGGTPEGQLALLADYGLTPASIRVPFDPTMEVRAVGTTAAGVEVVCSAAALAADRILLLNRVKPHTDFHSSVGSGLLKMLVVGLGKHEGARRFHAAASRFGYEAALRSLARVLLDRLPLLGGLAIIENQHHRLQRLEAVPPAQLEAREEVLCQEARSLMPRLPFEDVDLLIVDRMGKNISGTGMDPAIIGRMIHGYSTQIDPQQPPPRIRRLFVRDLTPESRGNAIGIGMADFTTDRLVAAMNAETTRINALTALSIQGAKVPIHFATDREAVAAALRSLALPDPAQARVVRILDTLHVDRLQFTLNLRGAVRLDCHLEITHGPDPMTFDREGNLAPWPSD